jgi:pantoate--beta-alanine ligase
VLIFTKIAELQRFLGQLAEGQTLGFVPTMGALHEGHISLIRHSRRECDLTLCSIFVNPRQFNDQADLARYPRTPAADAAKLENAGCDVLFMPEANEIYPDNEKAGFDLGGLDRVLEGESRPGHFAGVAQVVKRLFELVRPHRAYFGSKDYQQLLIVKRLVKQHHIPVQVIGAPTVREPDGLAMSSRNMLLSPEERKAASAIPRVMQEAKAIAIDKGIAAAKSHVEKEIGAVPLLELDYYEIRDAIDLTPVSVITEVVPAVSLIAVRCGRIRLIDNLALN